MINEGEERDGREGYLSLFSSFPMIIDGGYGIVVVLGTGEGKGNSFKDPSSVAWNCPALAVRC